MKYFKSFLTILNWQTLVIVIFAITSTSLCRYYEITADFPLTLVGIAVVFPLVFSINSAYKRRENALNNYGDLKAFGRAIYFASRDWIENPQQHKMDELKSVLDRLFTSINKYLHSDNEDPSNTEEKALIAFKEMSLSIKGFRAQGMSGSEVSRSNQYLSKMFISFEKLKHINQYRTPLTLRAYSKIFISILPIIYGPYFAAVTMETHWSIEFVLPILFSVILVSLDNIQEHLENPFDRVGEDDIYINSAKFIDSLSL